MTLQRLHDAACSDGDCIFKITPEMKKGMRTNGGCSCRKDMLHGIGSRKTHAVMVLSQIASEHETEVAKLKKELALCHACISAQKKELDRLTGQAWEAKQ